MSFLLTSCRFDYEEMGDESGENASNGFAGSTGDRDPAMAGNPATAGAPPQGGETNEGDPGENPTGGATSGDGDVGEPDPSGGSGGSGGVSDTGGTGGRLDGAGGTSGSGASSGGAGASSGGAGASSGGAEIGGGTGASGGGTGGTTLTNIVVTTDQDENDVGASVATPSGAGLSLREALVIANAEPGHQTITFEGEFTISLGSESLPPVSDSLDLVGIATIDAALVADGNPCLQVESSDVSITSLIVNNCQREPILIGSGSGNEVSGCIFSNSGGALAVAGDSPIILYNFVFGSAGAGIWSDASSPQIIANHVQDVSGSGIYLSDQGDGAELIANVVLRTSNGIYLDGPDDVLLWHNTLYSNSTGLGLAGASSVDFRNNIVSHSSGFGVDGNDGQFSHLDYDLFFENVSGDCNGCSPGTESIFADPLFSDLGSDDLSLQAGSPAIDQGLDLGHDRNLDGTGLFNGSAPDIGFIEAD